MSQRAQGLPRFQIDDRGSGALGKTHAEYEWLSLEDHPASILLRDTVGRLVAGDGRLTSCTPRGIRKQRGKRMALYSVRSTGRDGEVENAEVLVKLYGSDRGQRGNDALERLWRHGFRAPSPFRVPRPFGYERTLGALIQQRVAGRQWADVLARSPAEIREAARGAADWLRALQRSGVAAEAVPADEGVAWTQHFVGDLSAAYPASRRRLEALMERIAPDLEAEAASLVPSHGDFHPKNVFLDHEAVTVIDFDTFASREPGWDVGYAIAQLLVMSRFRLGGFDPGVQSSTSFWERYRQDERTTWERVATHVARSLLQSLHYELCVLANGRTELLTEWPELAERAFEVDGPGHLLGSLRGD